MRKFSIGDEVKLITTSWGDTERNPIWGKTYGKVKGKVFSYDTGLDIRVKWANGKTNSYENKDLALLEKAELKEKPNPKTKPKTSFEKALNEKI